MVKRTFKYCATHKEDENYMQQMCCQGWAAVKLVEGFWTFQKCEPNAYCYRICYLRGRKKDEIEDLKKQYAANGIEFVFRYSFWAIFRSTEEFELYTESEEWEICKKIYSPMPTGTMISWMLFLLGIFLAHKFSICFLLPAVLIGIYGCMCTWLAVSYSKLLKELS